MGGAHGCRVAVEMSSVPTIDLRYVDEAHKFYDALDRCGISADVVSVEADLTGYDLVIAPVMYMVKKGGR